MKRQLAKYLTNSFVEIEKIFLLQNCFSLNYAVLFYIYAQQTHSHTFSLHHNNENLSNFVFHKPKYYLIQLYFMALLALFTTIT